MHGVDDGYRYTQKADEATTTVFNSFNVTREAFHNATIKFGQGILVWCFFDVSFVDKTFMEKIQQLQVSQAVRYDNCTFTKENYSYDIDLKKLPLHWALKSKYIFKRKYIYIYALCVQVLYIQQRLWAQVLSWSFYEKWVQNSSYVPLLLRSWMHPQWHIHDVENSSQLHS